MHRASAVIESEDLSVGWHLWGGKSTFPTEFGPGFRYLITTEADDKSRTTDMLAVVRDFLPFCDVVSVADAYARAVARFGPELGAGVTPDDWYSNLYNQEHAARGRLFTAWTYHRLPVTPPITVGSFEATFTGWQRLPEFATVATNR